MGCRVTVEEVPEWRIPDAKSPIRTRFGRITAGNQCLFQQPVKATLTAFILHQLGQPDIAVYDGSMSEWASDAALPMERD
jgi:hypothetical protein